jgi:hypothetical protein
MNAGVTVLAVLLRVAVVCLLVPTGAGAGQTPAACLDGAARGAYAQRAMGAERGQPADTWACGRGAAPASPVVLPVQNAGSLAGVQGDASLEVSRLAYRPPRPLTGSRALGPAPAPSRRAVSLADGRGARSVFLERRPRMDLHIKGTGIP